MDCRTFVEWFCKFQLYRTFAGKACENLFKLYELFITCCRGYFDNIWFLNFFFFFERRGNLERHESVDKKLGCTALSCSPTIAKRNLTRSSNDGILDTIFLTSFHGFGEYHSFNTSERILYLEKRHRLIGLSQYAFHIHNHAGYFNFFAFVLKSDFVDACPCFGKKILEMSQW